MESGSPYNNKLQLAIILVAYLIFALIFNFAHRYMMNPDGISLLRLAGYIAEGNFQQSVTSGWSPLIIWVMSPFLFLGFDGLTAARISMALCGGGLLLCSWFLALRFDLPQNIRFIAVLIAALLISFWTIQNIGADVLVAALLLCYIYWIADPDILIDLKVPFLCGMAGGSAYLAHHYAFPFFLVHFPLLLLARGQINKESSGFPWKRFLISWGIGIIGFVLVASVWVGIVSMKEGQLMISSKGGAAHAVMGPNDVDRRHPFFVGGLFKPKEAYSIHVFEDPSEVSFKTWSPFESKEYFIHQLRVIQWNAGYIFDHFVNNSPFFTFAFVVAILVIIPAALLLNQLNRRKKFLYAWAVLTFCVYCSGFLLIVARSPRRFYLLMIPFLFLSFHFMEELKIAFGKNGSERNKKILALFLVLIACAAFAIKPGRHLIRSAKHIATVEQVNPYEDIAEQIDVVDFPAPYAVVRSSQKLTTDYYMAYFLKKQLLGRPLSADLDAITAELESAGGKSLVVFDDPGIVEELKRDGRYIHAGSVRLYNNDRYEHAANWIISEYDIVTGWDSAVNVFTLK